MRGNSLCRGKLGWNWSLLCDRSGVPVAAAFDGTNRHESVLLEPALRAAAGRGLLCDVMVAATSRTSAPASNADRATTEAAADNMDVRLVTIRGFCSEYLATGGFDC